MVQWREQIGAAIKILCERFDTAMMQKHHDGRHVVALVAARVPNKPSHSSTLVVQKCLARTAPPDEHISEIDLQVAQQHNNIWKDLGTKLQRKQEHAHKQYNASCNSTLRQGAAKEKAHISQTAVSFGLWVSQCHKQLSTIGLA